MKEHFAGKEVGYGGAISVVIGVQHFHIHGKKDPYYTMILMITYGTLGRIFNGKKQHINREMVRFKYPEISLNHYTYQHAVDDNNNSQKSPISMEKNWVTSC